jgi:alkylated DNA nucleotide flippase Atl1
MTQDEGGTPPSEQQLEEALAGLTTPAPVDFALRVLQRVGIPREKYDTYVHLDTPVGGLYVAYSPRAVTGSALDSMVVSPQMFEEVHRARTGRSAIPTTVVFPGLRPALRTGQTKNLAIELSGLTTVERAVLDAVRAIPRGQLRPIAWVIRETSVPADPHEVVEALGKNPAPLLVPCHRVTYDGGEPCDTAYVGGEGHLLRRQEGIDMGRLERLSERGGVLLASDTTRIYCHPTCAHARRITPPHQVLFRTARDALEAGYRACKSCRPVAA